MKIAKAIGNTESEKYLANLCEKTFLSLWSYSSVFRDQNIETCGEGKEVCDLLVVFDSHIIIFSDKACAFPKSGNIQLDWNRWFKRAIHEAAQQAWGAERWITNFPNRLFLDRACTIPFHYDLPDINRAIFHLVVVAHNVKERCQAASDGSGRLMVYSAVIGDHHYVSDGSMSLPFAIGDLDPTKSYVHVFDDVSLDIVLNNLDTTQDFVDYLLKRQQLIRSNTVVLAPTEEDLLAHFLMTTDSNGMHGFGIPSEVDFVKLTENYWSTFENSPKRREKLEANSISYGWDNLIEKFCALAFEGQDFHTVSLDVRSVEKLFRFLARESRVRRRILARTFLELIATTPESYKAARIIIPQNALEPYYIFLVIPHPSEISVAKYRKGRVHILLAYCKVIKLLFPKALDIVGIVTSPGLTAIKPEDALYFDARNWNSNDEQEAKELYTGLAILSETQTYSFSNGELVEINYQSEGIESIV